MVGLVSYQKHILLTDIEDIPQFENLNIDDIVTPIDAIRLEQLLKQSAYPADKATYLVQGFQKGFNIGYRGSVNRQSATNNLPIKIGSKLDIWTKIMKEVKAGRYAGPFDHIPFQNFIQSPIGLVPKAGGQTRLISYLSFDFGPDEDQKSLNYHTPEEKCHVKYKDLNHAIKNCLNLIK